MSDEQFMRRALELAEKGRYSTSPNPMVGCVLVRDGRVIGEGFHLRCGGPHAEIEAIRVAVEPVAGATAYVTLEPCSHHGRTGPCAEALASAHIRRLVVATEDPSDHAGGRGIARLRASGIEVEVGLLAQEARRQNEKFLYSARRHRPFVMLKAGVTLDGKIASSTGQSRWITSEESRHRSLLLREEYDAILVGAGTVTADDPQLTRRLDLNSSIHPWTRVVLDAEGSIPETAQILNDEGRTILYTAKPAAYGRALTAEVVAVPERNSRLPLHEVLEDLHGREIRSVLVEGGSLVLSDFIERELWQKMTLFIAPMLLGGAASPSIFLSADGKSLEDAHRLSFDDCVLLGPDLMITAYPRAATAPPDAGGPQVPG